MFHPFNRRAALAIGAALCLAGPLALAQGFPAKPITLVVPFPPGGPADVVARALGDSMAAQFRQPVVVENRSGATGNLGAQAVARAAPDGHTLLLTLDSSLTANPTLYGSRMGFDVERDLQPISIIGRYGQMLVVNPASGIADFKQFAEAARKGLNYASAGNASPGHLTMEALQSLLGGQLNHVPYRGAAPAIQDLLGGQVQAGFVVIPGVLPYVASGKLRPLAVSGRKRSALAPEVPTIGEVGYPAATTEFSFVLLAPGATAPAVVRQLNGAVVQALGNSGVSSRLRQLDVDPVGNSAAEAVAELAAGRKRWAQTIRERAIQVE